MKYSSNVTLLLDEHLLNSRQNMYHGCWCKLVCVANEKRTIKISRVNGKKDRKVEHLLLISATIQRPRFERQNTSLTVPSGPL